MLLSLPVEEVATKTELLFLFCSCRPRNGKLKTTSGLVSLKSKTLVCFLQVNEAEIPTNS